MSWLNPNPAAELEAPLRGKRGHRTPAELLAVVAQFDVETAERYRVRDFDGDGNRETWCNRFAVDVCRALDVLLPYRRANVLHSWLLTVGEGDGWCTVNRQTGRALAVELGWPVLACWKNPREAEPGHIAVLVPYTSGPKSASHVYVAQAGRANSVCMPLESAFGARKMTFFAHD